MRINQQYIADLLKVSRVTVTKALQDHSDIAQDTRKKVKDLADQLGYIPNGIGRSLSTKKTQTIGIVVPKIDHSFFSSVIEDMFIAASEFNYKILLMVSFESEEIEFSSIKTLLSMNVDGIIIDSASETSTDKSYSLIEKNRTPFLFFDRKLRTFDSPGVFFDDEGLSYKLTKEVLKRGYKKIMYMTGPQHINIDYDRLMGFKKAINENGIDVPVNWILKTELDRKSSFNAFKLFLKTTSELPEVIFCSNDSLALGVYDACKSEDIAIPDDLSVVGFGALSISSLVQPALTTVELNEKEACHHTISTLVRMIESEVKTTKDSVFSGKILLRGSIKEKS